MIHQVKYNDHGTERDIAYRMSFAEMIVPYRDPSFDHYRRTAYDIGEWGLGLHDDIAGPRLRLSGRDPLPGRCSRRQPG